MPKPNGNGSKGTDIGKGRKGTDYKSRHKPITERIGRLQGPTPAEVFRRPTKGLKKDKK